MWWRAGSIPHPDNLRDSTPCPQFRDFFFAATPATKFLVSLTEPGRASIAGVRTTYLWKASLIWRDLNFRVARLLNTRSAWNQSIRTGRSVLDRMARGR